MILNSFNNFFIDFIDPKKNTKLLNQVFIPHLKNLRKKKKFIIKMRLENAKKSFRIKYSEFEEDEFIGNLTKLIKYAKKVKFAVCSWRNMIYYMLFVMKIY